MNGSGVTELVSTMKHDGMDGLGFLFEENIGLGFITRVGSYILQILYLFNFLGLGRSVSSVLSFKSMCRH